MEQSSRRILSENTTFTEAKVENQKISHLFPKYDHPGVADLEKNVRILPIC
jgi:hypothetical protein